MDESEQQGPVVTPFRVDDVPWEDWSEGIRFGGRVRRIGAHGGGSRVGVLIEELSPGKQSVPLHWHTAEEEHVWFLEGRATLRLGDERYPVTAGDYVCFPAGRPLGHCIVNDSEAPCRYLVVGAREPGDVCLYPDSGKVQFRAGERFVLSTAEPLDYWHGEKVDERP